MKRFTAIVLFFFSLVGFAVGIFLMYMGETLGGVLGFLLGFSLLGFGMRTLKSSKLEKEIPLFLQNINAVPDLPCPFSVVVNIKTKLKVYDYALNVYLNGNNVGKVQFGNELRFDTNKEKNLLQIGGIDGPFKLNGCASFFETPKIQNAVNFEIRVEKSNGVLVPTLIRAV